MSNIVDIIAMLIMLVIYISLVVCPGDFISDSRCRWHKTNKIFRFLLIGNNISLYKQFNCAEIQWEL